MISNSGHDERGKYSGGKAGDQTGGEWAIIPWYNRPWNCVIRFPDANVRERIASNAEKAANNNNIGYDQGERWTYWDNLKKVNYDPAAIKTPCESDCSAGVLSNVKAAGYQLNNAALKNVNQNGYTGNMKDILKAAGATILTASKYLTSDKYLLRGDILLYEGHHTATNLTNGSLSGASNTSSSTSKPSSGSSKSSNVLNGQKWINSNYGTLIKKYHGVLLNADGQYGSKSRAAALCVWKDLVNRKYGKILNRSNTTFGSSCKEAAKKALVKLKDSGTFPYLVQFILSAKGYYTGSMNANYDGTTKKAVIKFQNDNNLSADGVVGANTWYKLFN